MNLNLKKANEFLKYANGDYRVAKENLKGKTNDPDQRRWSYYGFQQSIEKALKSIIQCYSPENFQSKHSLTTLMDVLQSLNIPEIELTQEQFDIASDLDRFFVLARYPDDIIEGETDTISEDMVFACYDLSEEILSLANSFVPNFIPRYLQIYPSFDDEESVSKLKKWSDMSDEKDRMPSFQYIDSKSGNVFNAFVNYKDADYREKELPKNKRFMLLKNGKQIYLGNSMDSLIHDFKRNIGDEPKTSGGGR